MYIELVAKGKSLEEALTKLKDRREAAKVQLDAMGADKDSIALGTPRRSSAQGQQQQQIEMMVMQRITSRGRAVPKGLQVPKSVAVSTTLTAEWPLKAETPEALLLELETLKEKVTAADLAGVKQAEKLSPEEEELAEEMAQMMQNRGEEAAPVGQPVFIYVARITPEDRDKAMARAFAKARTQAEMVARAAGVKLGPLVGLSGHVQGGRAQHSSSMMYGDPFGGNYTARNYFQSLLSQQAGDDESGESNETTGGNPGQLSFTFVVTANFALLE
jgi:hypothetical protein